jgi:hypothetical protein
LSSFTFPSLDNNIITTTGTTTLTGSHSRATAVKQMHTSTSTFVGDLVLGASTTYKFDGSATPRAHTYLYGSSSDTQDTIDDGDNDEDDDDDKDKDEYGYEGGGNVSVDNSNAEAEAKEGVGERELYIDKYGRRIRRSVLNRSSLTYFQKTGDKTNNNRPYHRRNRSTGSVYGSTPHTPKYGVFPNHQHGVDSGLEEAEEEEEEEEEDDEGEEKDGDGDESDHQNDDGHDGGDGGDSGPNINGKSKLKDKKRKRKAKKRKKPVTVPLATTLSHSHSVPNLRSELNGSASITDANVAEDAVDGEGSSSSEFTGNPIIRLGLGSGSGKALVSSVSFPEGNSSKKLKKEKGKRIAVDSFVLRGDTSNGPVAWLSAAATEGGGGFVQSKRARLGALARHLQVLFPDEREVLRKVIGRLDGRNRWSLMGSTDVLDVLAKDHKKKQKQKQKQKKGGKLFLDDCSLEYSSLADSDLQRAVGGGGEEEVDPDPRGDSPSKKDPYVHVFIDQYVPVSSLTCS